jgi:hypothetical protein
MIHNHTPSKNVQEVVGTEMDVIAGSINPVNSLFLKNGRSGFMGEHSMMDGTPTHRLNHYVCEILAKNKLDHGSPIAQSSLPLPEEITFTLTPRTKSLCPQVRKKRSPNSFRHTSSESYTTNHTALKKSNNLNLHPMPGPNS